MPARRLHVSPGDVPCRARTTGMSLGDGTAKSSHCRSSPSVHISSQRGCSPAPPSTCARSAPYMPLLHAQHALLDLALWHVVSPCCLSTSASRLFWHPVIRYILMSQGLNLSLKIPYSTLVTGGEGAANNACLLKLASRSWFRMRWKAGEQRSGDAGCRELGPSSAAQLRLPLCTAPMGCRAAAMPHGSA